MGYISFLSRKDSSVILHSNVLYDSADQDDELDGFLIGDTITLSLEIDSQKAVQLQEIQRAGVKVVEKIIRSEDDLFNFVAKMEFQVVKRTHTVSRDWTTRKIGFRSTGTLIHVEAVSNEAEELFIDLQKAFDTLTRDRF